MKQVLIPTDFSQIADYALDTALKLFGKRDSHFHLLNVVSTTEELKGLGLDNEITHTVRKEIETTSRSRLQKRKDKVNAAGIKCDIYIREGDFISGVEDILDQNDFDMIVMGSHGKSGVQDVFIGSYTQKVIRKCKKDLLVVKSEPGGMAFQSAAFVSALNESDKPIFERYLNILSDWGISNVHVVAVKLRGYFSQPTILMKEVLNDFGQIATVRGFDTQTHFYPDYSVEAGIRHFSDDFPIDIIGIANESKNVIKRIFLGSNVEMMVNNSSQPVLSLDKQGSDD